MVLGDQHHGEVKTNCRRRTYLASPIRSLPSFLTGNLLEEFGGAPIIGEDVIVILKNK